MEAARDAAWSGATRRLVARGSTAELAGITRRWSLVGAAAVAAKLALAREATLAAVILAIVVSADAAAVVRAAREAPLESLIGAACALLTARLAVPVGATLVATVVVTLIATRRARLPIVAALAALAEIVTPL